jgi:hypothetical protein
MNNLLKDAYKLADNEALKISSLPRPGNELARTIQVFATALVLVAREARRAEPVIEAARKIADMGCACDGNPGEPHADGCVTGWAEEPLLVYDGIKPIPVDISDIRPKADLSAPLIESKTNPGAA